MNRRIMMEYVRISEFQPSRIVSFLPSIISAYNNPVHKTNGGAGVAQSV
jgi:hypothetical protein